MTKHLVAISLLAAVWLVAGPQVSLAQVTPTPSPVPSPSVTPSPVPLEEQIFAPALPFVHFMGRVWAVIAAWFSPANFKPLTCQVAHWLEAIPYFPTFKACATVSAPQIPKLPSIRREQPTFAPGKPIF